MIDCQLDRSEGVVPMSGAINRSFINAHFLLSAYFLTTQTYKCMHLITRVYSTNIGALILLDYLHGKTNDQSIQDCKYHNTPPPPSLLIYQSQLSFASTCTPDQIRNDFVSIFVSYV